MSQPNKKAVLWVRVSTEDQAKYGTSPETQERMLRDYTSRKDMDVVKTFVAVESGKYKEDKHFFSELIEFVKEEKNEFDSLLVIKIDRAGRNLKQWVELHEELRQSGRSLVAIEQGIDTTTIQGQLQANIMMSFAEYERQDIIAKTKRGTEEVLKRGFWPKNSPTGFTKDRTSTLKCRPDIPKEPEYSYVKRAYELFLKNNYTLQDIVEILYDEGFKVSKQTLSKILHNKFYAGYVTHNNGSIDVVGVHYDYRVVDLEEWLLVQTMLNSKNKSKNANRSGNPDFILAKTLLCSNCRKPLRYGYSRGKNGGKYGYYFCRFKECASKDSYGSELAHGLLDQYLSRMKVAPEHIERIQKKVIENLNQVGGSYDKIIDNNHEEKTKLESALLRLEQRYTLDEISEDQYKSLKKEFESQLGVIKTKLAELIQKSDMEQLILSVTPETIENIPRLYEDRSIKDKLAINRFLFPGGLWIKDSKLTNPLPNPMFRFFGLVKSGDVASGDLPGTGNELEGFLHFLRVFHRLNNQDKVEKAIESIVTDFVVKSKDDLSALAKS